MKIALYGTCTEELKHTKELIQEYLGNIGIDSSIDFYAEYDLLKESLLQYDIVSLTERFLEILECRAPRIITFSWGKKIKNCYVDDIYYAEAELKNVHIRFEEGEMMVHLPFSKVEQLLEREGFIKVHRSYLVNCRYIQSLEAHTVHLKNGAVLSVSKYRREEVNQKYLEYLKKSQIIR